MKTVLKIQVFLLLFNLTGLAHAQEIQRDSIDLTNYSSIREAYYQAFDKTKLFLFHRYIVKQYRLDLSAEAVL